MGDFTSVGGQPRQQIFMLDLSGPTATVTGWTSPEFDGSRASSTRRLSYQCATAEPFYVQAAAWSPDDSTIYIGDTGYHPNNWPAGATPRNGLCDAAAAFPATQATRHATVDQLHRLRLALRRRGRRQHGLLRRPRALVDEPNGCDAWAPARCRPRHGGADPGHRRADDNSAGPPG